MKIIKAEIREAIEESEKLDKEAIIMCEEYLEKCADDEMLERLFFDSMNIINYVGIYMRKIRRKPKYYIRVKYLVGKLLKKIRDKESKDYYNKVKEMVATYMTANLGLSDGEKVKDFLKNETWRLVDLI